MIDPADNYRFPERSHKILATFKLFEPLRNVALILDGSGNIPLMFAEYSLNQTFYYTDTALVGCHTPSYKSKWKNNFYNNKINVLACSDYLKTVIQGWCYTFPIMYEENIWLNGHK